MNELPHKLRLELAMQINKKMYSSVKFLEKKQMSFVAWVGSVIHPMTVQEHEYICKEGEEIIEIYFLVNGRAGFCLPRYENKVFLEIEKGDHFGHIDLLGVRNLTDSLMCALRKKKIYSRRFTILAIKTVELLTLPVAELEKMRLEFPDEYK
jgi:CRP-like cAMP-binding protein